MASEPQVRVENGREWVKCEVHLPKGRVIESWVPSDWRGEKTYVCLVGYQGRYLIDWNATPVTLKQEVLKPYNTDAIKR